MENTPKDRAKILIEELKILQGDQPNGAKFFRMQKMDSRARRGCLIPQNRGNLSSLWVMRFRGATSMFLVFRRLLSHARKVIQGAIPMADRKQA